MTKDAKKAAKTEKKLKVTLGGYQVRLDVELTSRKPPASLVVLPPNHSGKLMRAETPVVAHDAVVCGAHGLPTAHCDTHMPIYCAHVSWLRAESIGCDVHVNFDGIHFRD